MQNSPGGTVPPPPPPAAIPPEGYWPQPQKPGMPAWAIVVIVVVVVLVVLAVLAAVLYVMVTGLIGPPDGPSTPKPQITFGPANPVTNGFGFDVAGASQAVPAGVYSVALSINGTSAGPSQTLTSSFSIGGYAITWTDLGGEGDLTGGDTFRVTRTPFPPQTDFEVTLLWLDDSIIGSRNYTS